MNDKQLDVLLEYINNDIESLTNLNNKINDVNDVLEYL